MAAIDDAVTVTGIGPFCYENWRRAAAGNPSRGALEHPLFTDSPIIGPGPSAAGATGAPVVVYGPYHLFNAIASGNRTRPAIVLRVEAHWSDELVPSWNRKTDTDRYHGGDLADEIAALMSLCLGIRAKSGEPTRIFGWDTDPRGRPFSSIRRPDPVVPPTRPTPILPRLLLDNAHTLESMAPFARLLSLAPRQAVALIRAARSYQEAMWIGEGAPETAWLLFVTAIEIAANQWRVEDGDPVDRLRASRTGADVERVLRERGGDDGDDLVARIAALLADSLGATKKFTDFMMNFLPEPPAERPHEFYQLSWQPADMRKSVSKVYEYRSKALHRGIPFPAPMCAAPHIHNDRDAETPGTTYGTLGGVWTAKDLPMLLHTFEYIVRGALLKWWQSMIGQDGQTSAPVDEAAHG